MMKSGLFLVHLSDGVVITHFTLLEGVNVVGRCDQSQIFLADWTVSRPHAELHVANGCVRVRDLKSFNGTFIDERKVRSSLLCPGQKIRFGEVTLELSTTNPSDGSEFDTAIARLEDNSKLQPPPFPTDSLTATQNEVFEWLQKGLSEKEVATKMGISQHTVHNHIRKIYLAFRVHSRAELLSHMLPRLDQTVILGPENDRWLQTKQRVASQ